MEVKLGMRVDLTQTPVASMEASLPKGPGIAPGQKSPLVVQLTYTSDFSGKPGMDGTSGLDGTDGTGGMSRSMDPNNPSPGGDASNGSNGSDGHDRGNAPPVGVRVTLQPGSDPLLQVSVSAAVASSI